MIRKLDASIANKIAAGEVVERPAAVVKELVENAIDAGASEISVEIKDAGKKYIRVSDNGSGIEIQDLPLAFERHATSKIDKVEDIYAIATLGFRGEALASIASVSRIELTTKTASSNTGTKAYIQAGVLSDLQEVGTTQGTTLIVSDLFYNTPVRYKFLKSNQAEQSAIVELMNKLALSHTEISFTLTIDGRDLYRTDGRSRLETALMHIYGREMVKHLIPIEAQTQDFTISGFVSKPSYTRGNRKYQMIFVNGRFVQSQEIQKTINNAYKGLTTIGHFGVFALSITMPYDHVDVNIHPAKTEIRFKDPLAIEGFVFTTVKHALMGTNLVPKVKLSGTQNDKPVDLVIKPVLPSFAQNQADQLADAPPVSDPLIAKEANQVYVASQTLDIPLDQESYASNREDEAIVATLNAALSQGPGPTNSPLSEDYLEDFFKDTTQDHQQMKVVTQPLDKATLYDNLTLVGVLFNTYIITEREGTAYIIDQHAAHERVLFEQFLKAFKNQSIASQMLLAPILYEGDFASHYQQSEALAWFENLGLSIENFGDNTWIIRSVPILNGSPLNEASLKMLLDTFEEAKDQVLSDHLAESIIKASCRAAVKARDALSPSEIMGLFDQLKPLDNPYTCPHGRPIIIEMTEKEFEKRFKRIQ